MKNTNMKTTLRIAMLVLCAGFAALAFAGLIGIFPTAAFLSSEVAFFLYAATGMTLIGLCDNGSRVSYLA